MQALANQFVLTNTKNKIQLNDMLTESCLDPDYFTEPTQAHTLTIAGVRDLPVEITGCMCIDPHDLRSTDEVDILNAQHDSVSLSLLGKYVRVVCDDTDVFVILVHYYNSRYKCRDSAPMVMSSPVNERAVIYIGATVEAHSDIADDLLAIHGLSGADAVASFHGIDNTTVVKVAKKAGVSHSSALVMCMLRLNMLRPNPLTRNQTEDESENTIEDPDDNDM